MAEQSVWDPINLKQLVLMLAEGADINYQRDGKAVLDIVIAAVDKGAEFGKTAINLLDFYTQRMYSKAF